MNQVTQMGFEASKNMFEAGLREGMASAGEVFVWAALIAVFIATVVFFLIRSRHTFWYVGLLFWGLLYIAYFRNFFIDVNLFGLTTDMITTVGMISGLMLPHLKCINKELNIA